MSEHEWNSSKGLEQSDLLVHNQVCSFPLEGFVFNLLDDDNNIANISVRNKVTFSVNNLFAAIWRSFVNAELKFLILLFDFLAFTVFALLALVNDFSLSIALVARSSLLSVHARSKLHHSDDDSLSFALGTLLDCFSVCTTDSITFGTCSDSVDIEFYVFTVVEISKSTCHLFNDWFHLHFLGFSRSSSSTKHASKHFFKAAATASFSKSFFSVSVIEFPLFSVH